MSLKSVVRSVAVQDDLNFLITNRIPRVAVTQFMNWWSRIRNPLIRIPSIALMRFFSRPDLSESAETSFASLHDCFIRSLKPNARPIDADPGVLSSPCDAIVGSCGKVDGTRVFQIKGFTYSLEDLLRDAELVERYRNGRYVTLRLTAGMYHRFHAPADGTVNHVTYISGDTWNTNPIALNRVDKLFCKNERALVQMNIEPGQHRILMVPVASILVASIRMHFLDVLLHLRYKGATEIPCGAAMKKGQEMGWFELGSTILVFAPDGFALCDHVEEGIRIKMGEPLLHLPEPA
ncbi:MAG: archaetidylserine decarboxylase [Deltaproteobacteria bacterium]|nr:archaetidylserine decarboxylase [Deltaproteobacteria bacterium]